MLAEEAQQVAQFFAVVPPAEHVPVELAQVEPTERVGFGREGGAEAGKAALAEGFAFVVSTELDARQIGTVLD